MNNSLDFFELQFEEQFALQGEILFDNKAVEDLLQVDKRLWIAIVSEHGESQEVEVLKPKTQSRQCTCDCSIFSKHGACQHIVATLFALRNHLEAKEKSTSRLRKTTKKTLNVNTVLNFVSQEQLANFVKGYSRKDKKFSTLLKAHFARQIEVDDDGKYKALLQSVIKPIQTADVKIPASQVKHFVHVCEELVDQMEDAMVLKDYKESVNIWQACTAMTAYVQHYTNHQLADIEKMIFRLSSAMKQMIHIDLSPELRQAFIDKVMDIGSLSYYNYVSVPYNVLEMIFESGKSSTRTQEQILTSIEDIIDNKDLDQKIILFALRTRILFNLNRTEDIATVLQEVRQEEANFIKAILKANDFECASVICSKILEVYPDMPSIQAALIEIYQYQNNIDGVRNLAFDSFLKKHELRYFDILKQHTPKKEWKSVRAKLLKSISKVRVRTESLKRDLDWPALIEELRKEDDLRLTMQYTYVLNLHQEKGLSLLYEEQMRSFLSTHLGIQAGIFFREVLMHLETIGALASIKRIHRLLDKEFSHRSVSEFR